MSKAQPHPGHLKHLCKMVEDKVPIEKIKTLVKDAKYVCKGCMLTAAKAEKHAPQKNSNNSNNLFYFFLFEIT